MSQDISQAEDAFGVLASQLRLKILEALTERDDGSTVSFTELYERVDSTNTSQFSYHLQELTGQYVHQTADGYGISDAGRRIVQAARAGEYTTQPEFDSVTVSTHCPYCGATTAEASYEGELVTVDCVACANTILRYDLRPGHVEDRDSNQALRAADRQMQAELGSAMDGVCQRCGGSIDTALHTGPDVSPATALLTCDCLHCGTRLAAPVEVALVQPPRVACHATEESAGTQPVPTWERLPVLSTWDVAVVDETTATISLDEQQFVVETEDGVDIHPPARGSTPSV